MRLAHMICCFAGLNIACIPIGCVELPADAVDDTHQEPELAESMSRMQYYSQKLGYSINAENSALAEFYHHELEELTESLIAEIPVYEGHEIGSLTEQLLMPIVEEHHDSLEARDWPAARDHYQRLIRTCNACHQATDHAFVVITPAEGDPPFNQVFERIAE